MKHSAKPQYLFLFLSLFSLFLFSAQAQALQISHNGFTWTLSGNPQHGRFANGEPWVVGPVTLTGTSVNANYKDVTANGSMINPVPKTSQGLNRFAANFNTQKYDHNLNVGVLVAGYPHCGQEKCDHPAVQARPVQLQVGDSLVTAMHGNSENLVKRLNTLTVVAAPPAAGSFRPAVYGPGPHNVVHNVSQINYSVLRNIPLFDGINSKAYIDSLLPSATWMEWHGGWAGNQIGPANDAVAFGFGRGGLQHSNYGKEIAKKWGTVITWLNFAHSQADKENAVIHLVQAGIDIAAYMDAGGDFYHDGGHKLGRRLPLMVAGMLLGNQHMINLASNPDSFQEDQQTFFVTQAMIDYQKSPALIHYEPVLGSNPLRFEWISTSELRTRKGKIAGDFLQSDIGMAEWGVRHRYEPIEDDRRWPNEGGSGYRSIWHDGMTGSLVIAYLMGLKSTWSHEPSFAYLRRITGGPGTDDAHYYSLARNTVGGAGVILPPPPPPVEVVTFEKDLNQAKYYVGDEINLSLSHSDSSAEIRYTIGTDPEDPDEDSLLYSTPLLITANSIVKARAYISGEDPTPVSTISISFDPADERPIDRSDWQVVDFSSEGEYSSEKAPNILDGNEVTMWHTRYSTESNGLENAIAPHHITIDMGECYELAKVGFVPRQDVPNGRLRNIDVYILNNLSNEGAPAIDDHNLNGTSETRFVDFPQNTSGRYLKLVAGPGENGPWASLTELYATGSLNTNGACSSDTVSKVASVAIEPLGGTFVNSASIALSVPTANAQIYYTIDGTTPSVESNLCSTTFELTESAELKAIAILAGSQDSDIVSASFEITQENASSPPAPLTAPSGLRVIK